jgi:UDP-N-acetyl-D-galactosamine dehydrogenase
MNKNLDISNVKIGIIGLGYVGLPLAVEFSKKYQVIGFDINSIRVNEINSGIDSTMEISNSDLNNVIKHDKDNSKAGLIVSDNSSLLSDCNVYIVTVPTPTDKYNRPVLTPLQKASETVALYLKKGDVVVYESTVYPGVTEEECLPILESKSKLKINNDFYLGYSPERINPGDKLHTVSKILKITSGSNIESAEFIDQLYKSIILAGTHKASSIKVAEAAKVIENSQRDINIAFVNELSKIFNLIGIDTYEVLAAAGTKWNFLNFKPGLVGGHCIGVDPYYLAQKAQELGYHPEIILAGRRTNDGMGKYVAQETIKQMMKKDIKVLDAKVLILGFTFKENCPDVRNTKVIDIYSELISFDINVDIFDPLANPKDVKLEYGIELINKDKIPDFNLYSAIILAVSHDEFRDLQFCTSKNIVVFDVKGCLPKSRIDSRL